MTKKEILLKTDSTKQICIAEKETGYLLFANISETDALLEYQVEDNKVIRPNDEIYPNLSDEVIKLGLLIEEDLDITEDNVDYILEHINAVDTNKHIVALCFAEFEVPFPEDIEEDETFEINYLLLNEDETSFECPAFEIESYDEDVCFRAAFYSFENKLYAFNEGACCMVPPSLYEIDEHVFDLSFFNALNKLIN